jgi:hypothetical protein
MKRDKCVFNSPDEQLQENDICAATNENDANGDSRIHFDI